MQQGQHEAKIVEQAQKLRMPLPDAIKNKPRLRPGLEVYYMAFWECSTDRQLGMAEGPIPWTAINAWAIRHGFVGAEEFDRLVRIIKMMDVAYIEHRTKDVKKKAAEPIQSKDDQERFAKPVKSSDQFRMK